LLTVFRQNQSLTRIREIVYSVTAYPADFDPGRLPVDAQVLPPIAPTWSPLEPPGSLEYPDLRWTAMEMDCSRALDCNRVLDCGKPSHLRG
jgi:hypothetical protein